MIPNRTLIASFVKTAKENGAGIVRAKLPRNHSLVLNNVVVQIRNNRAWAEYCDELGNMVVLCNDGITRQYTESEYNRTILGDRVRYNVVMRRRDTGTNVYLSVRDRIEFGKRTADKHLHDVQNSKSYTDFYDRFTLEKAIYA